MKKSELKNIIKEILIEFKGDLKKQCVMLMGLPASGKSTFINSGALGKYIPGMKSYKITNSDSQVKALQYRTAKMHYDYLINTVKNEDDIRNFSLSTEYYNQFKKTTIMVPITWDWWKKHKDDGIKTYFDTFFKPYYSIYFDIRDTAIKNEEDLFQLKIKEAGNLLIIDTTGTNIKKAQDRFIKAHNEGFNTSVVYLEIDPKDSIARDEFRRKHHGRGVGENVIMGYAKKLPSALATYKKQGVDPDGYVDRIIHFKWVGGADPKSGKYALVSDKKYTK